MKIRTLALSGTIALCALTGACGGSGGSDTKAADDSPYKKYQPQTNVETNVAAKKVDTGENVPDVKWYTDWNEAMAAAKKEDKPIFIHFTADWCKFCVKMKKETYAAGEIKKRFNDGWITLMVDTEQPSFAGDIYINEGEKKMLTYLDEDTSGYEVQHLDMRSLLRNFGVSGLPTLVWIDKDGKPLNSHSGYLATEDFAPILDFIQQEAYKTMNFEDFLKNNGTNG